MIWEAKTILWVYFHGIVYFNTVYKILVIFVDHNTQKLNPMKINTRVVCAYIYLG